MKNTHQYVFSKEQWKLTAASSSAGGPCIAVVRTTSSGGSEHTDGTSSGPGGALTDRDDIDLTASLFNATFSAIFVFLFVMLMAVDG